MKARDYRDYRLRVFRSDCIQMVKARLLQDKRNARTRPAGRSASAASLPSK